MEIYNEDCFETLKRIKDNSVDLFLLDLPYGQTSNKWDVEIDLNNMWKEIKRTLKKDGIVALFCTTKFGITLINSNKKWFKYDLVLEKTKGVGFLCSNKRPLRNHEMIYIFKERQGTYNPQMTEGKPYIRKEKEKSISSNYGSERLLKTINKGERHPLSIQKFKNPSKPLHPTQKSLECLEWLIKTYSNENDLIVDFTMGSGSTGEACQNTKRKFIGCEKDKEIFEIAKNRLIKK
jgi:site-specific DNA-methyltransferase (adenine-specific)